MAAATACLACTVTLVTACGRKGPPLVPLVRIPAPVEDLTLRRLGDEVYISFSVPARNVDGSTPPDVTRVELLALDADRAPAPADFRRTAARLATFDIVAASPGGAGLPHTASSAAPGERITVRDTWDAAAAATGATRFYLAVAYGPRDRTSPGSATVALPSGPAPEPPELLELTFSPELVTLTWSAPASVSGYHVYRALPADGVGAPSEPPVPLTSTPLDMPLYAEPVSFGVERCYTVRSLSADEPPIEGAASSAACITPEDIFPPSAPAQLTAVAGPDGIALRWTPSPEPDVAGYVVLRGTTADDTLLPITDVPVVEPRLLDRDVVPGVRYVYAVVAVDSRQPTPNRSPESPRDAVTAR